jgi:2,5-diketo-D-gluconate reductase A
MRSRLLALLCPAAAAATAAPVAPPAGGTITIAPGVEMPIVSNGYSPFTANSNTTAALKAWFRVGGRAVDTAFEYSNEPWVGDAVRAAVAGGLKREDMFVITKIKCQGTSEGALALVQEDLRRLKLDYVDLVIIHGPGFVDPQSGGSRQCDGWRFNPTWPNKTCCKTLADIQATYRGLEMAVAQKLARSIGVSNFQSKQLEAVVANATVLPAVNQMQMYVGCKTAWCATNNATIATGKKHGVTFQAYSPLGHGKAMSNPAGNRSPRSVSRVHAKPSRHSYRSFDS